MEKESLPQKISEISKEVIISSIKVELALMGPLGTAIDEILFGIGDRIRAKRLARYVQALSRSLKEVDESKIDKSYLESEEFFDLTIRCFNAAIKSRLEEKHKILANIYIHKLNYKEDWRTDLVELFIDIVNEFSVNHIIVFRFLVEHIDKFKDLNSYEGLYKDFLNHVSDKTIDKYEFRLYCRDIANKSLLRFNSSIHEYGSSGGYIATEDYTEVPGITLTSLGEKFIKVLENKKK